MATKFVYSGAAGANDGSSWTDAWTSLASSNGVAAGDIVKVHKTHSQTGLAANINWSNGTLSNPVRIICVDKDNSDAPDSGASIEWTTTNLGPQGSIYSYGIHWKTTAARLTFSDGNEQMQFHENGKAVVTGGAVSNCGVHLGTAVRGRIVLRNFDVDLSGATNAVAGVLWAAPLFEWIGGTYTTRATQNILFTLEAVYHGLVSGVHITGTVTTLVSGSTVPNGTVFIRQCTLPSYTNVTSGNAGRGWRVNIDNCAAGTITVPPLGPTVQNERTGSVSADLTRYRTGGADDGEQANAHSWAMAASANASDFVAAHVSPPITRWVDAGAQTLTVYVASGVTLQDDECWVEVLSPSEAGSATAQAKLRSTRAAPLATPADLTTDGASTWNGAGVGTKQKIDVAISPTIPGPVTVRVHLAKASTTVYVDPRLEVA